MAAIQILIVDDNRQVMETMLDYLELSQFEVDCAYNGEAAIELCRRNRYDVIVMDIMMPKLDGLQAVKVLRQELKLATPVLFLTAKDSLEDKKMAFHSGGDDYLIKPFSLEELALRLVALSKRGGRQDLTFLKVGQLCFNQQTAQVTWGDTPIKLAPKQKAILLTLMQKHPNLVTRQMLIDEVWGLDEPKSDALRSHLYALRQALHNGESSMLQTLHAQGYRLLAEISAPTNGAS
ncbi:DNA-binding response regulator [Thiosulfatimonas sediminis]|uniref:DNA-binding response regulator n=1 Tax=Thiosulfatimonas sediminis TaxID=2675054 RepID=A0A6F8PT57_9GAMM|nr:response regulator transcription factor [Thiosulfatimonas sediminis]BBP45170.1 DNA-binding response regulator [Thiosulfatimonas sediminis]